MRSDDFQNLEWGREASPDFKSGAAQKLQIPLMGPPASPAHGIWCKMFAPDVEGIWELESPAVATGGLTGGNSRVAHRFALAIPPSSLHALQLLCNSLIKRNVFNFVAYALMY